MSIASDIKRVGQRSLMVWIPADLHAAFKLKLAQDGMTARAAIVWILTKYTQFKRDDNGQSSSETSS